jgi:hypothetical protein
MKYFKNPFIAIVFILSLITSCTPDKDRLVFSEKADIYLENLCIDIDSTGSEGLRIQYLVALRCVALGGQQGRAYMAEAFGKTAENLTFRDLLRAAEKSAKEKLKEKESEEK